MKSCPWDCVGEKFLRGSSLGSWVTMAPAPGLCCALAGFIEHLVLRSLPLPSLNVLSPPLRCAFCVSLIEFSLGAFVSRQPYACLR